MSDEEIKVYTEKKIRPGCHDAYSIGMRIAFLEGAKYMRTKMQEEWGIIE